MSQNLELLKTAIQEYQEVLQCKRRLVVVNQELHSQKIALVRLKKIVEEEHQDVLLLENSSLKQLFSMLLLNKQAQLEKERQEYLLAALNYNECQNIIDLLKYEKEILTKKLESEISIVNNFEKVLDNFNIKKKDTSHSEFELLKSLNEELKALIKLKAEAKEAMDVIDNLTASFEKILEALEQANRYDEWGHFYKQRQIAKVKKKQYIDLAQAQIYIVKKQLIFLRSELLDIEQFKGRFVEARDLIKNFNLHYYNELITDWINVLKLHETIDHTLASFQTITNIQTELEKLINKSDQEYQILLIKRATQIEKIAG